MSKHCILYLLLFSYLLHAEECQESCPPECITLTVASAISQALNYNRQLMNTIDTNTKAEYNLILAQSEFDVEITPNTRVGYTGGKKEGTGIAIGGGVDFSKKFTTGTRVIISPAVLKTPEHYHTILNATISQPLLRGFGREYQLSRVRGAEYALRMSCRALYMAQAQLVMRTIQTIYEVVKSHKAVELNQESHERTKKFYQAAKMKEKIGLSDASDVYRAEVELSQAEDSLRNALERAQDAEDHLRDMLALPLDACIRLEVPLAYTENTMDECQAIELALDNRIELDQAEDQWRESYRLSRIAKNNLYPAINLVFDYANCGYDEIFTQSCIGKRENKWGVGFTTSGNINPVGEKMMYDESLIAINSSERSLDQTKANITLEVKKNLRNLQRAYERIELQEEQIKVSQGQLYLAQLKFERGMANNFDVIQAEKNLRLAQLAYWSAIVDHIVGEYQYLAVIGLLMDKPCIK